jgi:hypothetical protein
MKRSTAATATRLFLSNVNRITHVDHTITKFASLTISSFRRMQDAWSDEPLQVALVLGILEGSFLSY